MELLPFIALFDFYVIKAAWPLATGNAQIERREKILSTEVDFHAVQIYHKIIFLGFDRKGVHLVFCYGEFHAETLMPCHGAVVLSPKTPYIDAIFVQNNFKVVSIAVRAVLAES